MVLIKDDKYVSWENLIVLNVIRLYLNRIRYEIGNNVVFIKSENNSTKGILNLLEFSHVIFIHTIKLGIAVVNLTTDQ